MARESSNVLRIAYLVSHLIIFGAAAGFAAPSISSISPIAGHAGDVIHINGTGFDPTLANNIVKFGPNRAPVLAATATQLTVQVPNGQPLGSTTVSVSGVSGPKFLTAASSKIASIPPNPAAQCGSCGCPTCRCREPNSTPCVSQAPNLGGGPNGSIYGDRGEFFQSVTDLAIPGRPGASAEVEFRLQRSYRSAAYNSGPLGNKWNTSYFETLQKEGDGSLIDIDGSGRYNRYLLNNQGNYVAPAEVYDTLVKNGDGSYTLTYPDGTFKNFSSTGQIESITDRNGNSLTFSYNGSGQLTTVDDTLGRPITYTYNGAGQLVTVTDFIGRVVTYTYDGNGNLISATSPAVTGTPNGNDFPAGKTTRYTYDSNHNLLTITRPNEAASSGPAVLTNTYDSSGRIISQTYGGTNASGIAAGGTYTYTYTTLNAGVASDDPNLPVMTTQQTDPNGNVVQYDYNRLGYPLQKREYTHGIRGTDPPVFTTQMAYDADGRMTQMTLPAGNTTKYQYDEGNTDRHQQGNMLQETRTPDGARGGDQTFITTTYTYEPTYNHIATMVEPRGNDPGYVPQNGGTESAARYTTTYTYDAHGNLTEILRPTVNLPGGGTQTIETDYTYNSFGKMASMTDPEGNVTQYQYCPTATPSCPTASPSGGGYLQATTIDAATSGRRTEPTPPAAITTQYFYDGAGNVVRTIDGRGNDTLYTVNPLNQTVEKQSEAPYRYITYTYYDANDNIIQRSVENQAPTSADDKPAFTGSNFASADATPQFFVTRYTYDILDKLVTRDEDASGSTPSREVTQYRYDADRNVIQKTEPMGNVTATRYDERNLMYTETRGSGTGQASTTTLSYDANGNLATSMDGRGFTTTYQYDGYDRRNDVIDAVGGTTVVHYDPAGNVVSTTTSGQPGGPSPTNNSGSGNVILRRQTYEYDELSRRYQVDDLPVNGSSFVAGGVTTMRPPSETTGPLNPGDISTQLIYDRDGRVVQRTEDDGAITTTQYDGVSRRVQQTDPQGNTVATSYDADSNVIRTVETDVSEKAGVANETITTTYQYDNHNRQTISVDNCGNTRQTVYDSRNNLTGVVDAKGDNTAGCTGTHNSTGNTTRYTYDGQNRRLQSVQDLRVGGVGSGAVDTSNSFEPSGQIVTTFVYDANGRRTSMTDSNGNVTQYGYDALNRLVAETLPDATSTAYTYDPDDNILTVTDNNGTISTNTYDAIDRLTQTAITPAAGVIGTTLNTYQYDGLGRMTQLTDNNNPSDGTSASTVNMAYDSLGRVVEESQNGHAVDGAWFGQAQRAGLTYPNGRVLNYTYDALERMATVQDHGAAGNIAQYTYMGPLRVLTRQYQNGSQLTYLDNAGAADVGYDGLRRPIQQRDLTGTSSLITGFTYTYDRESNKNSESKLHQSTDSEIYSYDSIYRLTQFESGTLSGGSISGPPAATEAWTLDGLGNWRVDTVNGTPVSRTVNSLNEYTTVGGGPFTYDANGNLLNGGLTYQYDYRNRLREVCTVSGSGTCSSAGATVIAVYSYDAFNRRTRKVVTNSGALNGTTSYYYDGWETVEERNGADTETQQYVYGVYLDEPLAMDISGGARYFYHQNAMYSTFALTDAAANIVEGYQYTAYGQPSVLNSTFTSVVGTTSTVGNPYLFTGQRLDPETGLMYYKNRYYSPSLGRFLSRDPKEDIDINLFNYVADRPTAALDPLGLCKLFLKRNAGRALEGDCGGAVEFAVEKDPPLEDDVLDRVAVSVCREFYRCEGANCVMTTSAKGDPPDKGVAPVPTGKRIKPDGGAPPAPIAGSVWKQSDCCCVCRPPENAANPGQPMAPQAGPGGGGGPGQGGGQGNGQGAQGGKPNNQQGAGQGGKPNQGGNGLPNRQPPKPVAPKPQPKPPAPPKKK